MLESGMNYLMGLPYTRGEWPPHWKKHKDTVKDTQEDSTLAQKDIKRRYLCVSCCQVVLLLFKRAGGLLPVTVPCCHNPSTFFFFLLMLIVVKRRLEFYSETKFNDRKVKTTSNGCWHKNKTIQPDRVFQSLTIKTPVHCVSFARFESC